MSNLISRVRVGRIGRPHGLDGSFYVVDPKWELLAVGREIQVQGAVQVVERRDGTAAKPLLRLEGYGSREEIAALRGFQLEVTPDALPTLGPDEYWIDDLLGCSVMAGGELLGEVVGVLERPSCQVLEVRYGEEELLVPMIRDAVVEVNCKGRQITVDKEFLGLSDFQK